jgi:hypothetical protein
VLIGRLIRLVITLALLVGAIAILLSLVVQPFVEHQAASAVGKQLGTKVTVDSGSVFSPGVIKGDVGPLKIHADTFTRGVIPVRNLTAKVHGASLAIGSIFSGSPKLEWSSLDMTAEVRPGALAKYLRGVLAQSNVPGAERAFVHMAPGSATLIVDRRRIPIALTVVPPSSVKVTPTGNNALVTQLANALQTKVDVGPLPYGLRLTGITLVANAARVTAHAGNGSEKL